MTWRAFVGGWDDDEPDEPEWVSFDRTYQHRADAVDALLEQMNKFITEPHPCSECAASATNEMAALNAAGGDWDGEVEGDDYILRRVIDIDSCWSPLHPLG